MHFFSNLFKAELEVISQSCRVRICSTFQRAKPQPLNMFSQLTANIFISIIRHFSRVFPRAPPKKSSRNHSARLFLRAVLAALESSRENISRLKSFPDKAYRSMMETSSAKRPRQPKKLPKTTNYASSEVITASLNDRRAMSRPKLDFHRQTNLA
jgi:hypothetical protein